MTAKGELMNLTAPARAILAFTIAAALAVSGMSSVTYALATLLNTMMSGDAVNVLSSFVPLGLAITSFLIANSVKPSVEEAWAGHLASATRILAGFLAVLFTLRTIAAIIEPHGSFPLFG